MIGVPVRFGLNPLSSFFSVAQWGLKTTPGILVVAIRYSQVLGCSVLQCVAVCCSALQCVAVNCSVLQCVAIRYSQVLGELGQERQRQLSENNSRATATTDREQLTENHILATRCIENCDHQVAILYAQVLGELS